ncbi:MAG: TrbG/VirB9 family P-type conjugative transfer protein [Fusobacterium sp.]|nr:TrbG/VirB9 family P-type conjugative transfer protein [Fusobacterium sp.]
MKKRVYIIMSIFMLISSFVFADEINLYSAASRKEPINVGFKAGNTYRIYTKPLHQTIITFGNEVVEYSETGDNINFNTIDDKHSIRLKVIDEHLDTDLVVKTNENIYYFKVSSTLSEYNPMINFLYPQKEFAKKRKIKKETEPINLLNLDNLNNSYTISKKTSWTPTQIFDDGVKTYLIMPLKLQEMPVFLVRTDDKQYALVTFRVKETEHGLKIFVIDRIFREGVLKLGKKTIIIKNKNYNF